MTQALPPLPQLEASGLYEVILSHVDHRASGKLRCEVLAEFPSFEQDTMDANMTVIGEWEPSA